ncbi:MAG: zinc ribbon domain-containing protein [Gammaproteobacteria bacterium]
MPTYDFHCEECGDFAEQRPMSASSEPTVCPICHGAARRVIAAPFLATMKGHNRIAHARNEKSAHEPRVMRREQLEGGHSAHGHRHHGHEHSHSHYQQSPRPWMIGH